MPTSIRPERHLTAADLLRDERGRLRWRRRVVAAAMLLLVALAGARLWFVRGLWQTHRVEGDSMAETLLGAHHNAICADCGIGFRFSAEQTPAHERAVCPNCGYADNEVAKAELRPGQRVLVDGWPLLWRPAERGELVMAASPDDSLDPIVKRVSGLPGEQPGIRHGDLYAGKEIVRKSFGELREVAVLVHDNDYQPQRTKGLPLRWRGETDGKPWQTVSNGYHFEPQTSDEAAPLAWLLYDHWPCVGPPQPRAMSAPVLDNDSFNQSLARQLNAVTDLLVTCRVTWGEHSHFALALQPGGERFVAVIEPAIGSIRLLQGDREILRQTSESLRTTRSAEFAFALCDRQVLLAVNDRPLVRHAYQSGDGAVAGDGLHPVAIGAKGGPVEVAHLQVWRDLYLLEPLGTPRRWQAETPLLAGQIALLGDNPPVSSDSRQWPQVGVSRAQVLGVVFALDR